MMDRVIITRPMIGIFSMQVCAVKDATDEEILQVCNTGNPSGTENGWVSVVREIEDNCLDNGNMLPVQCEDHEDRMHFIVNC